MIDIHAHILPAIDDGSSSMGESLEMAVIALESGVDTIVATPHCDVPGYYENYNDDNLRKRLEEFRSALKRERIPLTVLSGMEIFTMEDTAELMKEDYFLPLNHSHYYLMEFSFELEPSFMEQQLKSVLKLGAIPILAHPERYEAIQYEPEYVGRWIQMGCRMQCNKGSILGRFGSRPKQAVDYLAKHDWIHVFASDAHSAKIRTPEMAGLSRYLEEKYSYEYAKRVLFDNPRRIIEDKQIPIHTTRRIR